MNYINHPDRIRWNHKYAAQNPDYEPHPLLASALATGIPAGPIIELACGLSGNVLALAELGREVWAVDISDLALEMLRAEARRRAVEDRINFIQSDLLECKFSVKDCALLIAIMYWEKTVFNCA